MVESAKYLVDSRATKLRSLSFIASRLVAQGSNVVVRVSGEPEIRTVRSPKEFFMGNLSIIKSFAFVVTLLVIVAVDLAWTQTQTQTQTQSSAGLQVNPAQVQKKAGTPPPAGT